MEVPFIPDLYADTVYCTSFSKSLSLAGERVGYLAVAEQVAEHDRLLAAIAGACRVLGYINVSSMFQLVAAECAGETADLSIYETNRDYLYRSLTELGYQCVRPDGAFYPVSYTHLIRRSLASSATRRASIWPSSPASTSSTVSSA